MPVSNVANQNFFAMEQQHGQLPIRSGAVAHCLKKEADKDSSFFSVLSYETKARKAFTKGGIEQHAAFFGD